MTKGHATGFSAKRALAQGVSLSLAAVLLLSGCELDRPVNQPEFEAAVPKTKMKDHSAVLNSAKQPAIVDVPVDKNMLIPQPLEQSTPLPDIRVENFNSVGATMFQAFRLLLQDTGISVVADPRVSDIRLNTVDLSGNLQEVLDTLSEAAGIFYTYKDKSLKISTERNFIVSLPPLGEGFDAVATVIENLGGLNVSADKFSRSITFRSNRQNYETISAYLENIRKSKVLIVFETYFFEVQLTDARQVGIEWDQFDINVSPSTDLNLDARTSSDTDNAISFGVAYTSAQLNVEAAVEFLQTQGNVEIISKPTLTVVSGSAATFEIGGQRRFVSEVGSTATEGSTITTVSTEELNTGLQLTVTGDYYDQTVFADIDLQITNFLDFEEVTTGGTDPTTLQLPITTNRNLTTTARARPGDTILLAGINESRDNRSSEGVPGVGNYLFGQTGWDDSVTRSELVIIIQPRVLRFVPRADKPVLTPPVSTYKTSAPTSTLTLPEPGSQPSASGPTSFQIMKRPVMPTATSSANAPAASPATSMEAPAADQPLTYPPKKSGK